MVHRSVAQESGNVGRKGAQGRMQQGESGDEGVEPGDPEGSILDLGGADSVDGREGAKEEHDPDS